MEGRVIEDSIKRTALLLGFADCRFCSASPAPTGDLYRERIRQGKHAGMEWMEKNIERRLDPDLVLPGCASIISVAYPYGTRRYRKSDEGSLSLYACGQDYHKIIEEKLADLIATIEIYGGECRGYVDSGPVLERDYAVQSGFGWLGSSGMIIRDDMGARFFI